MASELRAVEEEIEKGLRRVQALKSELFFVRLRLAALHSARDTILLGAIAGGSTGDGDERRGR